MKEVDSRTVVRLDFTKLGFDGLVKSEGRAIYRNNEERRRRESKAECLIS